jgi:hypothetical protein
MSPRPTVATKERTPDGEEPASGLQYRSLDVQHLSDALGPVPFIRW